MRNAAGFLKIEIFNALNFSFENVKIVGKLKCCGMEDRTVAAYGYRNKKKLICGMEGKNVVACGRLPSLPHMTAWITLSI